jgi:ribonucleoside-triphosphate reductase (thioredoxin)
MKLSSKILSDITVHMKYAKYIPELKRRETWEEIVDRNKAMHMKKFKNNKEALDMIEWAYKYVYNKKVVPSMRSMQFAGKPIDISPNRIFNCAFAPINHVDVFSEAMFLLLGGSGLGISVQKHHIEELPEIVKPNPNRRRRYLIGDSIEGWSDAIKILMKSYFGQNTSRPDFDFSDIRAKGSRLITSGGKAPGPQPLKECIMKIKGILDEKEQGSKLTTVEAHDIMCHIADAVLAGGIRRAALLSLFSADDMEMMSSKSGNWWEENPQRGRANNSVALLRHRVDKEKFIDVWDRVKASGAGEPGIIFTNDKDWGFNPCCEIALRPNQMCNLTEINVSDMKDQEDFLDRAKAATILGTIQATFTDFHYLREIWHRNCEKDMLIGVSMTGIGSGKLKDNFDVKAAALKVKEVNKKMADILDIKPAARMASIKPSGTTSLVFGTSSGIHAWHAPFYIRRLRVGKDEAIYKYLVQNHPELVEDEYFRPHDTAVISIPQKAPDNADLRGESALHMLERVKYFSENWIKPGHTSGQNKHNISATVSIKDTEWNDVGRWMWENRDYYNGLSILPYDGGTYKQAPYEDIEEATYEKMMLSLKKIDLTKIVEETDETDLSGEIACAGGACELQ